MNQARGALSPMIVQIEHKRLLWCDAEANCHRLATRSGVADLVEKASRAGIDTLIVDVKPLGGEVLYSSKLAPRLGEVDGRKYPDSFDLLAEIIRAARPKAIQVHAAINVFSEGHREWGRGPAYHHPDWQATMHEAIREVRFSGGPSFEIEFVDPWNPSDSPVIYTRRSSQTRSCEPGKCLIAISGEVVTQVASDIGAEIAVPEAGCVLSLPTCGAGGIQVADRVTFAARPVFRRAEDSRVSTFGIFVNPIGPARKHEMSIIEEIVRGYEIDGIVFDRMRYPNLYADFSDASRIAFEKWLARGSVDWPDDVFTISALPWEAPKPGRYYKEWLESRARQIKDFAEEASSLVRSIRGNTEVAVYVGSWYESYYDVGVNWGSDKYHAGYSWMTPEYNRTGYADLFDYMCTGCYYPLVTRAEARDAGRPEGATVEAACELSRQAIAGASPVYGSLYLRDYKGNPDGFLEAIDVVMAKTDGVMLFDLVYLEDYDWWPLIAERSG